MMNLNHLNHEQEKAVRCTEGPLLILAGAGSGKTRVLTHRIAFLIEEKGVFPSNILAITFTNKAAEEMKNRVGQLVGEISGSMWMGTFHSVCVKILRRDVDRLGYTKDFTIYDPTDQLTIIKDCYQELRIDDKKHPYRGMLHLISEAKNEFVMPDEYLEVHGSDFFAGTVQKCYALYQKKLRSYNAMDFDDLILNAVKLFKQEPTVLEHYQNKFKYIMVDEYQDTNRAQYLLVNLLARAHKNLCVVGDNDQSIYGWRGADIRNILDFEKDYSGAQIIKLEQNYRSTEIILNAANHVISNNQGRKEKNLWTENGTGERLRYYKANNEYDEARFIVDQISHRSKSDGRRYGDFAVLYRTNAQSRVLEDAFLRAGIDYRLVGGLKFYDRKEIKDMMGYLRFIVNPVDEVSLTRVINVPRRGIGEKTLEKIRLMSEERDETLYETIKAATGEKWFGASITNGFKNFVHAVDTFIKHKNTMKVTEIYDALLESTGYIQELEAENTIEARGRIENIRELGSAMIEYENRSEGLLIGFLEEYSLRSDVDQMVDSRDSVVMMTLHSAKGLEFPVVFLAGMEENIFPTGRAVDSESDMEEERRLAYVGITRAEELLYLTHATMRTLYGRTQLNGVSRFIKEIPVDYLEGMNDAPLTKASFEPPQKTIIGVVGGKNAGGSGLAFGNSGLAFGNSGLGTSSGSGYSSASGASSTFGASKASVTYADASQVSPGVKVRSEAFGEGTVVATSGSGDDMTVTVAFKNKGIKKLKLSFANLRIEGGA